MEPPPAKRARRGGASAPAIASGGSRRTTRSQKPRLSAELLAKISTFSSLGDDLLNLCIVAGPKDCAIVRHEYLHKNCNYLWRILEAYVIHKEIDWRKCRDCYREWMEVNDWRELVTDELMEELAVVARRSSGDKLSIMIHPFAPFSNPSVAIEIGLMEALQYLVDGKKIDVNQYRWTSYKSSCMFDNQTCHLLFECLIVDNFEAFEYISGRGDIDFNTRATKSAESCSVFEIVCRQSRPDAAFFQNFIDSSNFDEGSIISEPQCNIPVLHWCIISSIVHSAEVWFDLPTWKVNFQYLLKAGANPHRSSDNGNAIDYAKLNLVNHPEYHEAMECAIEIMEMWGKKK